MRKVIKRTIITTLVLTFIIFGLSLFRLHDIAKGYIHIKNSEAKAVFNYSQSSSYKFNDYCEKYSIPKSGIVYLSGMMTNYSDMIIQSNEYCSNNENISIKPSSNETIGYYWTLKLIDNNVSEIWTCKIPLTQEQLKSYTFDEQVEMVPLFKSNRSNYAIGYYNTDVIE